VLVLLSAGVVRVYLVQLRVYLTLFIVIIIIIIIIAKPENGPYVLPVEVLQHYQQLQQARNYFIEVYVSQRDTCQA
jgi:hypothetical protein